MRFDDLKEEAEQSSKRFESMCKYLNSFVCITDIDVIFPLNTRKICRNKIEQKKIPFVLSLSLVPSPSHLIDRYVSIPGKFTMKKRRRKKTDRYIHGKIDWMNGRTTTMYTNIHPLWLETYIVKLDANMRQQLEGKREKSKKKCACNRILMLVYESTMVIVDVVWRRTREGEGRENEAWWSWQLCRCSFPWKMFSTYVTDGSMVIFNTKKIDWMNFYNSPSSSFSLDSISTINEGEKESKDLKCDEEC